MFSNRRTYKTTQIRVSMGLLIYSMVPNPLDSARTFMAPFVGRRRLLCFLLPQAAWPVPEAVLAEGGVAVGEASAGGGGNATAAAGRDDLELLAGR